MFQKKVRIIGGGLAGCEAAYWLANRGIKVELFEMRPTRNTEAHQTNALAELVCSNSFKSLSPATAPGILKREMEMLGSLAIQCARKAAIGAGEALAVDREIFAREMTSAIESHENIQLCREEVTELTQDQDTITILATGPLTSPALTESLRKITGEESFYFYDAISPIIDAGSIDMNIAWLGNRYGKATRSLDQIQEESDGDYINCPMNREQYEAFVQALLRSERVETKNFERVKHFEGCMPIEEMADRGLNTLRFGPMKPVGLINPRTNDEPYAAVQLRPENQSKTAYNLVGFQTKLKYGAQSEVFRMIPGLMHAEFLRLGSMHRNSFVDAPRALLPDLSLRNARNIMLAGQITGVEGYMESAACGMIAGIFAAARIAQAPIPSPPRASALGSLIGHVQNMHNMDYQPSGINFGLFEDEPFAEALLELRTKYKKKIPKAEKREAFGVYALTQIAAYRQRLEGNVL